MDKRKISELTEVTTLNGHDELVFVKYEGNQGPEPTPTPTSFTPSYSDNSIPTAVCLENATDRQYDNLILSGSYTRKYDYNGKPYYTNAYFSSQLKSMIWWRDDGFWVIEYSLYIDQTWSDYNVAYYSNEDVTDPSQVSMWSPMVEGWTPNPTVESGMCLNQISEKSYSVRGNSYMNGYDTTNLLLHIEGGGETSTQNDTINRSDLVYLENIEFNYGNCWIGDHVNFNEGFYSIDEVDELVHPDTGEKTWDLKCPHGKDVTSECGGLYVTNTGKLTIFFDINGGPVSGMPIRRKDTTL